MEFWQQELNDKRRKTQGWYGCIAPDGWKDLVLEADQMLAFIDPDYEIQQVKEKFGTLRFYFGSSKEFGTIESNIMYAIVASAESRSSRTCQSCGAFGTIRDSGGWLSTLCDPCDEERLERKNVG